MKTVRTYPKNALITISGLVLIYIFLCIGAILFSRFFLRQGGPLPQGFTLIIWGIIPGVLLIFFLVSLISLLRNLIKKQIGSRFHIRLLAYFTLVVLFAALPITIITGQVITSMVRLWQDVDIDVIMGFTQEGVMHSYASQMEQFDALVHERDFQERLNLRIQGKLPWFPEGITGVQDFILHDTWGTQIFLGPPEQELPYPPSMQPGFVLREMPRDRNLLRYVMRPEPESLRVITFTLGTGFDETLESLQQEESRFRILNTLLTDVKPFLILYYGIFFLPILLMTLIIAISLTRRVTQPIVELTEATRQVAAGDFSMHLQVRPQDELETLIQSFNTMVRDLSHSQASLVKAEKLSLWRTMAEQLAHEIKNPLTPIKLSAERVLRRWRREPERIGEILESSMEAIIQETEGLATMLTEFRAVSRPVEPSRSSTQVWELTDEILTPYRSSYPQVVFNISHLRPDIAVKLDRQRFSQVMTNLIINGIDAMQGKGTLEIRADLVKKRESRYCRLSMRDTGKGMTQQEQAQIFTPYYTTKPLGTGLGLAIVERIVHEHGGSIWFNSAEGLGTTFFIDMPLDTGKNLRGPYDQDPNY